MLASAARAAALVSVVVGVAHGAAGDGLAKSPPMGWRSWNDLALNISQEKILQVAKAMAVKRNAAGQEDPAGLSLLDLGYKDVGMDDGWQLCKGGVNGSFHDERGLPLVDEAKFPNMGLLVRQLHALGFKAGWYHNNCVCREQHGELWQGDDHYLGDVAATVALGFDSVKLDGCGAFRDLDKWYNKLAATSPVPVMIENCHWGADKPTKDWCPFHMYRTSGDISNHWHSMFSNLQTTRRFQDLTEPLSRPGCWAYPDMLEVGRMANAAEDRAHFGAWVITSSPLILGHNVVDEAANLKAWPHVSNQRAIAINQDWAGHPGRLVLETKGAGGRNLQVWVKPLSQGGLAVFVLNDNDPAESALRPAVGQDGGDEVQVSLAELGAVAGTKYGVVDVWTGDDASDLVSNGRLAVRVAGHDSRLLRLDVAPRVASGARAAQAQS